MDYNRVNQRWLNAYTDPQSYLYTFSRCMALADLLGDGDYKLALADLGTGTSNIKLKVYKGTSLLSENTLIEIPTALVAFYHDHHDKRIPSVAVASGPSIYVYKNMKPYYKFSLPDLLLNPLEQDLWMQARNDGISPTLLHSMLSNIKNEIGFSNLSFQSQKLLMVPPQNEEELLDIVTTFAPQAIKRQTVITCMGTLYKNSNAQYSISCLVVGTENGWIHIIDSEAFTILESVNQSADSKSTDQTIPVVIKTMGLFDVDFRIVVYNRNGKLTLLRQGWTSPKCLLHLTIQAVDMCLIPETGNIYLALMNSTLECCSKKGKRLWSVKLNASATGLLPIPLHHQGLTLMAVALEGGTVSFYHGKEVVDTLMAADTVAGMVFGRFGQEEHCLVLITISGALQIKVLKRTAQFLQQGTSTSTITNSQNLKLKIPKKTSLFLEQAGREMNQPIQIHRTFQKELFRFRLETARSFYKSLNKVNNSISNDYRLPLKLSTEVFGLGPTFKIVLTLENMSQTSQNPDYLLDTTLSLVFHYNDKIYKLENPCVQLPVLIPGLVYKFETKVQAVTDLLGGAEEINVFVFGSSNAKPLLSAVVPMPFCDVLPIEI
ncbi:hypothetical protein RUM44_006740 [Polyplax serrata]|uniref:Bardet-Biedl syndrome 1 n=1 Tax=Polyplax serrata TaxID=468196 RepID=A0ABR1AIW8_POLSC